jgi:hypothetical protein
MKMATLQTTKSTDGAGTGASHSGPCTVYAEGTFDSANVSIEISTDDSTYEPISDSMATFRDPGQFYCAATGTYYLRSVQSNSQTSTSITVKTTQ